MEFIDVNEERPEEALPSEAMSYNGVYLEKVIPGYRTLYVSGRETMTAEINDNTTGAADGSRFAYKRYPARTITVGYQLIAESNEAFRNAFNKMSNILDAEQVKVIFNDESDKYFIGTYQGGDDVDPGRNSITSEFEIYCTDPFKYSVNETEVNVQADGSFAIEYNGTYPSYPVLEATMENGENGFVGFVDANENILQFGDVEEADGETYQENDRLAYLSDFFSLPDDHGTEAMHAKNAGTSGALGTAGWFGQKWLTIASTGDNSKPWNGGMRTLVLPADSQGNTDGCKNFYSYFHIIMYAGLMGQTGEMTLTFLTSDDKPICGVNWYKSDATGNTGRYEIFCYSPTFNSSLGSYVKVLKKYMFTTSHLHSQNPWYWNWGHCDIRKEGSKLTFYYWGGYLSYVVPEVENMKCSKIQLSVKSARNRSGNKALTYLGFDVLSFDKLHVEKWRDVPNKFGHGSVLMADCSTGEVTLNGLPKADLGAVGNMWESFSLKPGMNQIKCLASEWAQTPTYKLRYREVFI